MSLTRRKAREAVFTMLFQAEFQRDVEPGAFFEEIMETEENEEIKESAYIKNTFLGAKLMEDETISLLTEAAVGWNLDRISKVSVAIIKLAAFEVLKNPDVPVNIAINEAVELSKMYDDEKVSAFVNAVLGRIAKNATPCEKVESVRE